MCGPYGEDYPVVNIAHLVSTVAFLTAWFGWFPQLLVVLIAWVMHLAMCCCKVPKGYLWFVAVASLVSAGMSFYVAQALDQLFRRRELVWAVDFCWSFLALHACEDPKGRVIASYICGAVSLITAGLDVAMVFTIKDDHGAEDEAVVAAIEEGSEEKEVKESSEDV